MVSKKTTDKKWIQSADLKEGAFTARCKKRGFGSVNQQCITAGKASNDPKVVKQATLAQTFKKMKK